MNVSQIIKDKGGDVYHVSPDDNLIKVVNELCQKKIGAVIVVEKDRLQGILSERDIVGQINRHGADAVEKKVSDCMTKDVVTVSLEESLDQVMQIMTEKRIRHIPVLEQGKVMGLISIGDVVKRKINQIEQEAQYMKDYISY